MKIIIDNYVFNHSAHTITFSDYVSITHARIMLVANVTHEVILYQFANNTGLGGTVATNVLTLTYNTGSQADSDHLLIIYDDPALEPAIASKQDTEITSLASIDGKLTDVATQTTLALIKAKTDNLDTALSGIKTGTDKIIAAPATSVNQSTEITALGTLHTDLGIVEGKQDTGNVSLSSIDGKIIAVNTGDVVVSLSALPSGAATEATLATRLSQADFDSLIGSLTETAPATDTASSGANGRLQRIAQRLTSIIALLPGSLGQKTMANSLAVVIASDQSVLSVKTDQTTPGTTDKVSVSTGTGAGAVIGVTTADAAVVTDATGTIHQYLRGLVSLIVAKISVKIVDGDDATLGITTGAAITTDTTGTIQGYIRGLSKALVTSVWDSTNAWLNVRRVKKDAYAASSAFTITLASLASSTAGVGRQSTILTSQVTESAIITVKFTVGTSPTANTTIDVYLIRGDDTYLDDNAGASDAGLTVINAPLLGRILVNAATSNTAYYGVFETKFLGSLGPKWGIAIVNGSGVTANGTGGNFDARYTLIS